MWLNWPVWNILLNILLIFKILSILATYLKFLLYKNLHTWKTFDTTLPPNDPWFDVLFYDYFWLSKVESTQFKEFTDFIVLCIWTTIQFLA